MGFCGSSAWRAGDVNAESAGARTWNLKPMMSALDEAPRRPALAFALSIATRRAAKSQASGVQGMTNCCSADILTVAGLRTSQVGGITKPLGFGAV